MHTVKGFHWTRGGLPSAQRRERGVAVVIVLAFVFLLTGLIVAFLSRVQTERSVANSSTNVTMADLVARSALDNVCSDLKQEIVAGSNATTIITGTGPASVTSTIYRPKAPAYEIPMRSGNPTPSPAPSPSPPVDFIPNLVRRSVRSDTIAVPGVPSRASAVNSATDVSSNGRSISPARWNAHYLIPRAPAATDTTPISGTNGFTAPDWVMVTKEKGPVVLTAPTTDINGSTVTAIGRYAYAIYDEGALLDANVAGFPSNSLQTAYGRKGLTAYADLTQLPTSSSSYMTQAEVDQLIGLRNFASAQPNGNYGAFSFDAAAALRYFSFVTKVIPLSSAVDPTTGTPGISNGFLNVSNTTVSGRTDQAFLTRQQLIQQLNSIASSQSDTNLQNVLQYLGTFSRDLEQPSFAPNASRPIIQANGTTNGTYGTGNDGYGNDAAINPSFLNVRAASAFTRNDGSTAIIGEPLVKQRFPLSRLSLAQYNATNSRSQTDTTGIYQNFGMYRTSATQPWVYDHAAAASSATATILKLSQVAALGREPDFFELLKAAIAAGSLAKGAANSYIGNNDWSTVGYAAYIQQQNDTSLDLAVLQVGANIIDQYDSDGIPTQIALANDIDSTTGALHTICGVEDLPYLLRVRDRVVQSGSLTGEYLLLPELWNPHTKNGSPTPAPTSFRFRVALSNSAGTTNTLEIAYAKQKLNSAPYSDIPVTWTGAVPMTFNAGDPTYYGFREPTLLAEAGMPSGTNLAGHTTGEYAIATEPQPPGRTLVGISPMIASTGTTFPWYYAGLAAGNYALSANYITTPVINCFLDCQDPSSGAWITYDQQIYQWGGKSSFDMYTLPPLWNINNQVPDMIAATRVDPRASRWGLYHTEYANDIQPITAGNSSYAYPSMRSTGQASYGSHVGLPQDNGFVNQHAYYTQGTTVPDRDCIGMQPGYWTENSIRNCPSDGTVAVGTSIQYPIADAPHYNRDPDGVVRRVVGGYASDPVSGGAENGTPGLPMVTAANSSNGESRPIMLNRPFRSVAELGYVFRGTPWGNLNFSFPESGDAALLDVFCVNELENANNLVAGRVNVNTRQAPVLQALLAGALTDDSATTATLTAAQAADVASELISRTSSTTATSATSATGPLANRAELVGRYIGTGSVTDVNPDDAYTGFAYDVGKAPSLKALPAALITRLRTAAVRGLADSTTARTWNLLIDLVAQTGRYPVTATTAAQLPNFNVAGEKHYWLHVAIDRYTGQILDQQLESVAQ